MQVKLGVNFSTPFTVTNEVKHGRVLSQYFFDVYFDELSYLLCSARVRCGEGNMVVNQLTDIS